MDATTKLLTIAITAACLLAGGCSTATMVRQDAHAGDISVEGSYMHSISRARNMAVEHCHGPVTLTDRHAAGPRNLVTFTCLRPAPLLLVDATTSQLPATTTGI